MKQNSYVVAYRKDGAWDDIRYIELYASSSQEAVDKARFETGAYEVTDCYKAVKNWN